MQKIRLRGLIAFFIILAVLIIDYLSKQYALTLSGVHIINSYVTFNAMSNYGVAFSIFNEIDKGYLWILSSLIIFILIFICVELYQNLTQELLYVLALSLIIGGGWSNLFDRFDNASVTDFIIIHYNDIYFPAVFNIADLSISLGAVLIIVHFLKTRNEHN
jgi:signal peptidase II